MPGSHKPEAVAAIQSYREEQGVDWESMEDDEQRNFTDAYTAIGLQPGILNAKAGDLIFFDTALYHGVCHAEDPVANGPNELLRAIFIQSMVPTEHLGKGWGSDEPPLGSSHRSDVLRARRIAFEQGRVTGGSVVNPRSARQILEDYVRERRSLDFSRRPLANPTSIALAGGEPRRSLRRPHLRSSLGGRTGARAQACPAGGAGRPAAGARAGVGLCAALSLVGLRKYEGALSLKIELHYSGRLAYAQLGVEHVAVRRRLRAARLAEHRP